MPGPTGQRKSSGAVDYLSFRPTDALEPVNCLPRLFARIRDHRTLRIHYDGSGLETVTCDRSQPLRLKLVSDGRTIIPTSFMKNNRKRSFAFTCAVLFLSPALQAKETCPVELKLLLSPPTIQTVVASLSFQQEKPTHVYFF